MMTSQNLPLVCTRLQGVLFVTINRPASRNALSEEVVTALEEVAHGALEDLTLRAIVLRGAKQFFCAGGNLGNFQTRLDQATGLDDPVATRNRKFGAFMQTLAAIPVPVVSVVEGAALGGGMGLACVSDIVLATQSATFALSETSLGVVPAQIMPFVVRRIGPARARRLGLSAERVEGDLAVGAGIVDALATDSEELDSLLASWLTQIGKCAPNANKRMKTMVEDAQVEDIGRFMDAVAQVFSTCMQDEGKLGIAAFKARQPAPWVVTFTTQDIRRVYQQQGTAGALS